MSAKFDYAEAERAWEKLVQVGQSYAVRPTETNRLLRQQVADECAAHLSFALPEMNRLRGELYAMHNNGAWKTIQCACPDCAAWRSANKETA